MVTLAPAVHVPPKSRWHPAAVDAAVRAAVRAARGCPRWLAVVHDGRVVGVVRGEPTRQVVQFRPLTHRQWCGFGSYDDLNTAAKGGQQVQAFFFKTMSSGPYNELWSDAWPCSGVPDSGDYSGTANTLRQFDNTTPGGLYISGLTPGGGQTRHVAEWFAVCTGTAVVNSVILYDRVAAYDGCSISTSPTTLTNTLSPARYVSAGQEGLLATVTVETTSLGGSTATLDALTFTDQNGTTGVAMDTTMAVGLYAGATGASSTFPAAVLAPYLTGPSNTSFPIIPLAAGASGVRKLEGFTSSATASGSVCWMLYHPCATFWVQTGLNFRQELARATFALERIYDDACLSLLIQTLSGNAENLYGYARLVHA